MNGLAGSLLSLDVLTALVGDGEARGSVNDLRLVLRRAAASIGPAAAARQVFDALGEPLARALGFAAVRTHEAGSAITAGLSIDGRALLTLTVGAWGVDLTTLWRIAVVHAAPSGVRWALCTNGITLRIVDGDRTYSRRSFDVDLAGAEADDETLRAVRELLRAESGTLRALDEAARASDAHRAAVGVSLQSGVDLALRHLVEGLVPRRRANASALDAALADALTVIYRILFLLFAEARGLVARWHPVYRDGYTIEALRPRVERERSPAGLWESLQAISRLAHRGCHAGTLQVTPFNGRLFAPSAAPLAESRAVDDRLVREVLLAITTRPGDGKRQRISYADLGVEQLGAVYERVLDYEPTVSEARPVELVASGRRKATGTFYTPRSMTEYLVRRTLAPLLRGRTPGQILSIRILDPAMGSGAFLVAACRYVAWAYEQALIAEGGVSAADLGPSDRSAFRRVVARRCLYGVDRNPTAVQLARLSLWLATLAADRPLTFLDHHLRSGHSLVGASPADVARQPPAFLGAGRTAPVHLPLFESEELERQIATTVEPRRHMADEADDSTDVVRRKERTMAHLEGAGSPLAGWRRLCDTWCSAWFWPEGEPAPTIRAWGALSAAARGTPSGLPPSLADRWLTAADNVARRERFLHWPLEFPEVFYDERGRPLEDPGFDAVIGNPPWDALRGDAGTAAHRAAVRSTARELAGFVRASGCYQLQGGGHKNLYQLFLERMLQLAKRGGRIGVILPSAVTSDHGCAQLRRRLLERCRIDALLSIENRDAVFPIHRGLRFVLLTADAGATAAAIQCRLGLRSVSALDEVPDIGDVPGSIRLSLDLVKRFGGSDLAIPEIRTPEDCDILAHVLSAVQALGSEDGWQASFGRELNATDDKEHFGVDGLPVLEGKLIDPFVVRAGDARQFIPATTADRLLGSHAAFRRMRLGYREVASSTNRLTLIAAMIPPDAVTTHTIFCLKDRLTLRDQFFLCGVFNSFVANYLVRLRVGTHVTAAIIDRLPVPRPPSSSRAFAVVSELSRALTFDPADAGRYARLQGVVARLYGLDQDQFTHVLGTFPLVKAGLKSASLDAFRADRMG